MIVVYFQSLSEEPHIGMSVEVFPCQPSEGAVLNPPVNKAVNMWLLLGYKLLEDRD